MFKHLQEHFSHVLQWSLLSVARRNTFKQQVIEAYFVKIIEPFLNSQMNSNVLTLFRKGITQTHNTKYSLVSHQRLWDLTILFDIWYLQYHTRIVK